jgi:hypothetical protein
MSHFESPHGQDGVAEEAPQMPSPEASDEEFASFLEYQLTKPFDSDEVNVPGSAEKHLKDQEFYLHLAEELVLKLEDEAARNRIAAAITSAKRAH